MIDISRRYPWSLNTESICPSFLDNPATHRLGNDNYWNLELVFDFLCKDEDVRIDLISLHPSNLGIFLYKNTIFLQLHQNNDGRSIFTKVRVDVGKQAKIELIHYPYDKVEVKYLGELVYTETIKEVNLDYTPYRHLYIGSNTHNNSDCSTDPVIRLYSFKISDESGVLGNYTWEDGTCFDGRVEDLTGNDNILYEVG